MIVEQTELSDKKPCIHCGALLAMDCKYCNYCGISQSATIQLVFEEKWMLIKQAALFYLLDVIVCGLALFDAFQSFSWLVLFDAFMALTAIGFFALNWQDNKQLLIWKNFSVRKLAAYGAIAMTGSLLVHYSVGWLNVTFYSKDVYYYNFFEQFGYGKALLIFFTAIFPALFEELGYRGYLLQTLLKVVDKQQAIYISAFLFAIIHLSFISLFWLIPFALFLGYTRVRENTIWYGVFFHFCFNLTVCLMELL
ncbi:MAG TPA: CPBP family intramembrane glutamic endopeptidase [Mucilaginibacter sp.]|nr:CPBP family intramembrane glutamic endopeptidase [Mucilaginibacter sp.]